MRIPSLTLAVTGLVVSLAAQGVNCTLLGTFNNHGPFNDIWGYTAPNGSEYALLGTTTGPVVVDVSNPSNPIERGWFPWASSGWRDIRTYGHYAYVVTEAGQGFQILSLSNPNNPSEVGIFGTSNSNNAHNVCVDTGAGRLYLVGCNSGTPVYDLTGNPANPSFIGYALGSGNSNYFHDLHVENGYGYGAMIYNGDLRIMDVTTWPPASLSSTSTPGNFTHNAWPNAAGTICVTTDEVSGGVVKFFDITNKSNPQPLGQYTANPSSVPHNAYIVGNLCHVSWYTEGYRCIDISNPNNPVEVASYDTWPGGSGGYSGAWGCYPFLPSGNVLISDRSTGLYIVKPNLTNLALSHAPLGNTSDEDGPYPVTATVTSANPISSIAMHWREGASGSFTAVPMNPSGTPNEFVGDIPGHDAVTEIQYYVEAVDNFGSARSPAAGTHSFLVGTINELFVDGFETDLGWTHAAYSVQDDWERGAPAGQSGTSGGVGWQDPPAAYAGNNVWANDLGNGSNGSYRNNNGNWLQSPTIATNGLQNLRLRFHRWLHMYPGDIAMVKCNGAAVYVMTFGINDPSWQEVDIDLSAVSNSASTIAIRFEILTDGSGVSGGWAIDEFMVTQISDSSPPQFYGTGTAGTTGIPAINLSQPAAIGTTTQIEGSSILPGAATFMLMNFSDDNSPQFGINLLVQTPAAVHSTIASVGGQASFPFSVPNDPMFDNLYLYSQIIPIDAGGPQGLAASQGMRFRVCLQ